jgi:hypothetical protein
MEKIVSGKTSIGKKKMAIESKNVGKKTCSRHIGKKLSLRFKKKEP